jgi:hypothetical protein
VGSYAANRLRSAATKYYSLSIIGSRNGRESRLFGRDTIANVQVSKRNRHGPRNNQDHEYNTPGRQPRP